MEIFITDNDGDLIPIDGKGVIIELDNGGTIGIAEEYSRDDVPEGISLWGGREPSPSLSFEEIKARTEGLDVYPIAANALHIFPYKPSAEKQLYTADEAFFSNQNKAMIIKKNSGFRGSQFADICYFLIAAHAGAALFHHYIQEDNTLLRVIPEQNHLNN